MMRDDLFIETFVGSSSGSASLSRGAATANDLISADSHVIEPADLWRRNLPERLCANLPPIRTNPSHLFGADPATRLMDQERDGVVAEVLFPTTAMDVFGVGDSESQAAAFHVYNDWLADFCRASPKRFFGIACVSVFGIGGATQEIYRAHDLGMVGVMIWPKPDPRLPFISGHYDRIWAAAAECETPIVCHIADASHCNRGCTGSERIRCAVNDQEADTANTLFDLLFSGAFDRNRKLKLLFCAGDVGWLPSMLRRCDQHFEQFRKTDPFVIKRRPSEIFAEHVYCTFLDDYAGACTLSSLADGHCLWASDYPHRLAAHRPAQELVNAQLANVSEDVRRKLVRENANALLRLCLP